MEIKITEDVEMSNHEIIERLVKLEIDNSIKDIKINALTNLLLTHGSIAKSDLVALYRDLLDDIRNSAPSDLDVDLYIKVAEQRLSL